MVQLIQIDSQTSVTGQLQLADLGKLAGNGVTLVINNRPDGEGFRQPRNADMAAEAGKHNLAFAYIPVSSPSPAQAAEFASLLKEHQGKVVAYCRSGNRSSIMWAAAKVALGMPVAEVVAQAAKSGLDLRSMAPFIEDLGKAATRCR
jgi:uncharacterized protein (TIGR01244 family)